MKEEDLIFGVIDRGSRGFQEVYQKGFELTSLLDRGVPKKHIIIYKLLMSESRGVVKGEAFEMEILLSRPKTAT